ALKGAVPGFFLPIKELTTKEQTFCQAEPVEAFCILSKSSSDFGCFLLKFPLAILPYVLLLKNNIAISMTQNGDPYENALAERVNGILKAEFDLYTSSLGFRETGKKVHSSIHSYNK